MNKLRKKILFTLISILSLFLISIIIIFNYQNYSKEKNNIKENLITTNKDSRLLFKNNTYPPKKILDDNMEEKKEEFQPKMFMDAIIYTIILDDNNNIKEVISRNDLGLTNEEIIKLANNILKNENLKDTYIGNLYLNRYSYSYSKNKYLTIIDNQKLNNNLKNQLLNSIIIFIILEGIIIILSIKLTKWITIPVEESFTKQKQFIEDASHELKTPIAVILASSEALENDPNEKKWLNNIQNEAERMNKLVKNMLDLARLENVDMKKTYTINNISKIIEKNILTFESLIYEKNITLDYSIEKEIELNCNPDQIKELLSILIDNAIKHSINKGIITISLKKDTSNIILEVKNKGEGIKPGDEEKIFERFYRKDTSRNRNENRYGLGLAIAKNIVTNHNGKISASSKDGYTTFKVIFKNR